jgi:hypothetical protein
MENEHLRRKYDIVTQDSLPGLSYKSKICILKSVLDFFAGTEMTLLPSSESLLRS